MTAGQQSRPAAAEPWEREREGEALYSALPLLPVNHFTDGTTLNTTTTLGEEVGKQSDEHRIYSIANNRSASANTVYSGGKFHNPSEALLAPSAFRRKGKPQLALHIWRSQLFEFQRS